MGNVVVDRLDRVILLNVAASIAVLGPCGPDVLTHGTEQDDRRQPAIDEENGRVVAPRTHALRRHPLNGEGIVGFVHEGGTSDRAIGGDRAHLKAADACLVERLYVMPERAASATLPVRTKRIDRCRRWPFPLHAEPRVARFTTMGA